MPLYEYICPKCNEVFERLRLMSEYNAPAACSKCGTSAGRIISSSHIRMAEPFRVVDSSGNITHEKQVLRSMPDWQDTKPIEHHGVPKPLISRSGNVYYPRKQRSNATV
ncbi:hypothetical protein LCGC14_0430890 [marine sediment metagenome]|uniref:Putative regulatory protein FmdB zinc ribbon domain-containing protein n=1 Tax=marine sediment metagenome TaxID=412755 RepID=A0A0F9SU79_9ZZZZ